MERQIVFVCQHGAFRSRIAAAYFNAAAPAGWRATSAGVTPQHEVSERLLPLLSGTDVEAQADLDPPRTVDGLTADRVVAIDADVEGAETWRTTAETDEGLRDEIRGRVREIVDEVSRAPGL
jgi:protein-tyrosine-phosphatase